MCFLFFFLFNSLGGYGGGLGLLGGGGASGLLGGGLGAYG